MPVEYLLLQSISSPDQWALVAGSTKIIACQTPDDEAASYIQSGTSSGVAQMFNLVDPAGIPAGATINSVTIRARVLRGGTPASYFAPRLVTSGGTLNGTARQATNVYADYSDTFIEKPGGGTWTLSDLNELTAGIVMTSGSRTLYCTTIEVAVDYTQPPAEESIADARHLGLALLEEVEGPEPQVVEESHTDTRNLSILATGRLLIEESVSLLRELTAENSASAIAAESIHFVQHRHLSASAQASLFEALSLSSAHIDLIQEAAEIHESLGLARQTNISAASNIRAENQISLSKGSILETNTQVDLSDSLHLERALETYTEGTAPGIEESISLDTAAGLSLISEAIAESQIELGTNAVIQTANQAVSYNEIALTYSLETIASACAYEIDESINLAYCLAESVNAQFTVELATTLAKRLTSEAGSQIEAENGLAVEQHREALASGQAEVQNTANLLYTLGAYAAPCSCFDDGLLLGSHRWLSFSLTETEPGPPDTVHFNLQIKRRESSNLAIKTVYEKALQITRQVPLEVER